MELQTEGKYKKTAWSSNEKMGSETKNLNLTLMQDQIPFHTENKRHGRMKRDSVEYIKHDFETSRL